MGDGRNNWGGARTLSLLMPPDLLLRQSCLGFSTRNCSRNRTAWLDSLKVQIRFSPMGASSPPISIYQKFTSQCPPLLSAALPIMGCSAGHSMDPGRDVGRQFFSCLQWECEPGHYSASLPNCYHDFLSPLSDDVQVEESDVGECSDETCCEIEGQGYGDWARRSAFSFDTLEFLSFFSAAEL